MTAPPTRERRPTDLRVRGSTGLRTQAGPFRMETMSVWPEAGPLPFPGEMRPEPPSRAFGCDSPCLPSGKRGPHTSFGRGRVAHRRGHAFGRDQASVSSQSATTSRLRTGCVWAASSNHRCQPSGAERWVADALRSERDGAGDRAPSGETDRRGGSPSGTSIDAEVPPSGRTDALRPIPVLPSGKAGRTGSEAVFGLPATGPAGADLRVGSKHRPTRSQTKPRPSAFATALGRCDAHADSEPAGRNGWGPPPGATRAAGNGTCRSKAHGSIGRHVVATPRDRNGLFDGRKP